PTKIPPRTPPWWKRSRHSAAPAPWRSNTPATPSIWLPRNSALLPSQPRTILGRARPFFPTHLPCSSTASNRFFVSTLRQIVARQCGSTTAPTTTSLTQCHLVNAVIGKVKSWYGRCPVTRLHVH